MEICSQRTCGVPDACVLNNHGEVFHKCYARRTLCLRNRRGQSLTEYILVVALIAIAAIGVVSLFGDNVRSVTATITTALAGKEKVKNKAIMARPEHHEHKGLKNFAEDNWGNN